MTTPSRTDLHGLLIAAQEALCAVVDDPTPATLTRLDRCLADFPLAPLSDGDSALDSALHELSSVRDHDMFAMLGNLQDAVAAMLDEGPREPVHDHPAAVAALTAVARCIRLGRDCDDPQGPQSQAWDRAQMTGFEALRAVTSFLYGENDGAALSKQLEAFSAAARSATTFAARDAASTALEMAAHYFGVSS